MPRASRTDHPLRHLRRTIGFSQAALARLLGVTPSTIKRIENRTLKMSQDLLARLFLTTGFVLVDLPGGTKTFSWTGENYTKESFTRWQTELGTNAAMASALSAQVAKSIEILLLASARPTVGKTVPVFYALLQSLHAIAHEFDLQKHIDALLRERRSTTTQLYRVGDLRKNSLLATTIQFKDDPSLKDDDQIPQTKPIGWLQHADVFNVLWNNRELLDCWISMQLGGSEISPDFAEMLSRLEKELEKAADA